MNVKYKRVGNLLIVAVGNTTKVITDYTDSDLELVEKLASVDTLSSDELVAIMDLMHKEEILAEKIRIDAITAKETLAKELLGYSTSESAVETIETVVNELPELVSKNGLVYLKGYSSPIHGSIVTALEESLQEGSVYTTGSIMNLVKWLMLNPNKEIREDLFLWLKSAELAITEDGNIIGYRNVVSTETLSTERANAVTAAYFKRKSQKKGTKNVYLTTDLEIATVGELSLEEEYFSLKSNDLEVFTDAHTGKFKIQINEIVSMPREKCSSDRNDSCSSGLHMRTAKSDHGCGDTTVVCLINPYNITAIPHYDYTKFRCCEYLPVAKAMFDEDGRVIELARGTYDFTYTSPLMNLDLETLLKDGMVNEEVDTETFTNIVQKVDVVELARNNKKRIEDAKRIS